jgi:glycosyltransferase involved in cell wall biosynthesis
MKVLFDHPNPFLLAHGGFQTQIEQTKSGLEANGVEVEYLRWWDERQNGDIIHYFGRPTIWYLEFARQKGMKIILAQLLTGPGSRPPWVLWTQKQCIAIARRVLPKMITSQFAWDSFQRADACVALTAWEAHLMSYLFGALPEKVHVLPNGVEEVFQSSQAVPRGPWLVCSATITQRKRVLELAEAAVFAQTPVWIIGKAYAESDPYAQRFHTLASRHPKIIRFEGCIQDRAKLAQVYREARGFVLLSTMESLSLSALEAAACECPLLLTDLPWARSTFGEHAMYCPITSPERTAEYLRTFYDQAPSLKPPPKPLTWLAVALKLKQIYQRLLNVPVQF